MKEYIGKICPYCKMDMIENEEIVVCTNCGKPHHKYCWDENHGCTTFGCDGKIKGANALQNADNTNQNSNPLSDIVICKSCGFQNNKSFLYCGKCGNQINPSTYSANQNSYGEQQNINTPSINNMEQQASLYSKRNVNEQYEYENKQKPKSKERKQKANNIDIKNIVQQQMSPAQNPYSNGQQQMAPAQNPYSNGQQQGTSVQNPNNNVQQQHENIYSASRFHNDQQQYVNTTISNNKVNSRNNSAELNPENFYNRYQHEKKAIYGIVNENMYIQKNIDYFMKRFTKMRKTKSKTNWNWAIFFFAPLWFLYRKMYIWGVGFLILEFVLGVISGVDHYEIGLTINWVIRFILAMLGNYIYLKRVDKCVAKGKELAEPDRSIHIKKYGGTNKWAVIIIMIVIFAINIYRYENTCQIGSCSEIAPFGGYCIEHVCLETDCTSPRDVNSNSHYCVVHRR